MITSLLFYLMVMFVCLGLINWSNNNNTKLGIYGAYLILIVISVLRFDIGNDYQTYTEIIRHIAYKFESNIPFGDDSKEPLITLLTIVFKDTTYPYLWVLGIHFIISLFFLYKAFEDNDSHLFGILIFFISGLLFIYWDQVRQAVSISIIIYAIKYIKENNFPKYLLFVLLAATAHYSALLLLPFYFADKVKPQKLIYIVIILALALSNAASVVFEKAIALIPYWEAKTDKFSYVQLVSWGYKFRIFFYSLVWSTIIYFLPDKQRVLINFLFVGAIIFILASGALNIMRISFYFIFTMTLSIPILLKIEKARTIMMVMVLGLFLFFVRDVVTNTGTRGCVPYENVFSDKFPDYFRIRE
ncbi:EpsG family protein [Paucihalobacter ruber]|uniref:EpsG family protein n=1 Tax=Paucihalobacter ruber TaxID=2567861 RepID=A0A506PQJ0_9FLAO|nr:EpsG family protein [Paucihalobacter ruber]TPV35974.1 EpsG family protein [Paucihalobacter ruber]